VKALAGHVISSRVRGALLALSISALLAGCGSDVRRTFWPDGRVWSEVHFVNGLPNGSCTTWHENGRTAREGQHLNGHRTGGGRVHSSDGRLLSEAAFLFGDAHGESRGWYPDGTPKFVGNYVSGRPSGAWVEYFANGRLSIRGNYQDGERDGDWLAWDTHGKAKGGAHYERGRFVRKIQSEQSPTER